MKKLSGTVGRAGDSDWWKSANWGNWREGEPADGITPATLTDPFWGAETILQVGKITGDGDFVVSRIKMEGVSEISCARLGVLAAGDNSAWQGGRVRFSWNDNQWGNGDVFFRTAKSVFPASRHFEFRGRMFFDFEGVADVKWDKFEVWESYGADFLFRSGAAVTIANLTGAGSMTDAAYIKVTGTITAKVSESGSVFTADCAVDLTGTTIVVDESEWEMADRNAAATIFTAQSITGMPTVHREEGESRRSVVTNTGTAIVVERVRPGLMIIFK